MRRPPLSTGTATEGPMKPIAIALACVAGFACCAAAQSTPPPNPPEKGACYELYLPVCATKDGRRATYSNKCFAAHDGATDITDGKCNPDQ